MAINYSAEELLANPELMQEYVNDTTTLLQELQAGTAGTSDAASVTYSDTAPSNPSQGDQWFHSDNTDLNLYVYESQSGAWIDTSPGGGGGGGLTILDTDILLSNPVAGRLYYIATIPYFRATLSNGTLIPACTSRDNDTLRFGASGTNIGLENTPFKTASPNIDFIMADVNFSSASRRSYTVRGSAKAGYFQNNNYIDTTPDTQAADIGKFAWVALGEGQNNTAAVGDIFTYIDTTTQWRKVVSTTDAKWI